MAAWPPVVQKHKPKLQPMPDAGCVCKSGYLNLRVLKKSNLVRNKFPGLTPGNLCVLRIKLAFFVAQA